MSSSSLKSKKKKNKIKSTKQKSTTTKKTSQHFIQNKPTILALSSPGLKSALAVFISTTSPSISTTAPSSIPCTLRDRHPSHKVMVEGLGQAFVVTKERHTRTRTFTQGKRCRWAGVNKAQDAQKCPINSTPSLLHSLCALPTGGETLQNKHVRWGWHFVSINKFHNK